MARTARGLPADFALDLPQEAPVHIGDFLDEEPAPIPVRKPKERPLPQPTVERFVPAAELRPEIMHEREGTVGEMAPARPVLRGANQPSIIRYQLNLTPKSKTMLEDLVKHVRTYSPQNDARVSEVFQGIMTLLHNAMDELELAELPRRGAWGSVTAKNFPGALSEAFERAIVQGARKRGRYG
jgi:hypothetical protein